VTVRPRFKVIKRLIDDIKGPIPIFCDRLEEGELLVNQRVEALAHLLRKDFCLTFLRILWFKNVDHTGGFLV